MAALRWVPSFPRRGLEFMNSVSWAFKLGAVGDNQSDSVVLVLGLVLQQVRAGSESGCVELSG